MQKNRPLPYALQKRYINNTNSGVKKIYKKMTLRKKNILSIVFSFTFLTIVGWILLFRANLPLYLPLISTFILVLSIKYYNKKDTMPQVKKNNTINIKDNNRVVKDETKVIKNIKLPKPTYLKNIQEVPLKSQVETSDIENKLMDAIKKIKSSKKLPKYQPFLTKVQSKKIDKHIKKIEKQQSVINE